MEMSRVVLTSVGAAADDGLVLGLVAAIWAGFSMPPLWWAFQCHRCGELFNATVVVGFSMPLLWWAFLCHRSPTLASPNYQIIE